MNQEANEELLVTFQAYQKKELDLLNSLHAINESFQELGIPLSSLKEFDNQPTLSDHDLIRQSGIRMKNKLSFRGRDKAREYFKLIDLNRDGLVGYEEFRAINSFRNDQGLILDDAYISSDAWHIFMQNEGYSFTPCGQLTVDEFIRYRERIELLQPIAPELRLLGLNYLPDYLLEWAKCKRLVEEVLSMREFLKITNRDEMEKLQGALSLDEMLYIANSAGNAFTKPEMALLMLWRQQKANTLIHLIRAYSKRNISQQEYGFLLNENDELNVKLTDEELHNSIEVDDMSYVPVNQFVTWLISCPKFLNFQTLYRQLIKFKYSLYRGIRTLDAYSRYFFTLAAHINDRLIFREFLPLNKLLKHFQDVANIKVSVDIGQSRNSSMHSNLNGVSMNWKLMKIENPEVIYKQYNLPAANIGTLLYFDLLFQAKVSHENKLLTQELMREFLLQYLEKEMKKNNANVYAVQCALATNELDDSDVLRIFIIYKKQVSVDKVFEHMLIPYRLIDLVTVLVGDLKTNIHLDDFFNHPTQSLNELFACAVSMNISLRKNIIVAMLERLIVAFSAGVTKEQAEFLEESKTNGSDNDPKGKSNGQPLTKQQLLTQHKLQDMKHEERLRYERWAKIFPHCTTIVSYCKYWYNLLAPWKGVATFRYSYQDLDDLMRKVLLRFDAYNWLLPLQLRCKRYTGSRLQPHVDNGSRINSRTPKSFMNDKGFDTTTKSGKSTKSVKSSLDDETSSGEEECAPEEEFQKTEIGVNLYEILHEKGYLFSLYQQFVQLFKAEFGQLFENLQEFLEERKKEDDAKRLRSLMTIMTSMSEQDASLAQKQAKETMERLKRLGISEAEQADLMNDEEGFQNPTDYIQRIEINQRQSDVLNIRLYECLKSFMIGLHTIETISGKHKLSVSTQEIDIFEILPAINIQRSVDFLDSIKSKASTTKEKPETMNDIYRKTLLSRNQKKQ